MRRPKHKSPFSGSLLMDLNVSSSLVITITITVVIIITIIMVTSSGYNYLPTRPYGLIVAG